MSAAPEALRASAGFIGRRGSLLGAANGIDYALQLLLPVVLVRCLDAEQFGEYRLAWLAAGTAMAVVTQSMAGSLFHYLPSATPRIRRLFVHQTLGFLVVAGLLAGWAASAWNPWLPEVVRDLSRHGLVVPAFVALWVSASLLDLLPTIDDRVRWQATATVGLSGLRAAALSLTAWLTGDIGWVLLATLGFVAVKAAVLLAYVARHHGICGSWMRRRTFAAQLKLALPFGASGALFGLRSQADLWVAAALFPVGSFAAFSIASVLAPLVNLFRQSVIPVVLPSMSRLRAGGDLTSMMDLNRRANALVASLVFPLLAFAFAFAEDLVTLVYTATYLEAAPVMRLYAIGLAGLAVELASTMLLLGQGAYALRVNLIVLAFSVPASALGAGHFGLAGAALGSVIAVYLDGAFTLRRISICTGVPLTRIQDWPALGASLLVAALSAAIAWGAAGQYLEQAAPLARLTAGAAIIAIVYGALRFGTALPGAQALARPNGR